MDDHIEKLDFDTGYWTVEEVAKVLNRSVSSMYYWRTREKDPLPYMQITGGQRVIIRFRPNTIRKWAKRNKVQMHEPTEK